MAKGGLEAIRAYGDVVAAGCVCELERLLGRKTMEVELPCEALDASRGRNSPCG